MAEKNEALHLMIWRSAWNQNEFARKVGISESMFSRIVSGEREATLQQKSDIAKVLSCEVEEAFPKKKEVNNG